MPKKHNSFRIGKVQAYLRDRWLQHHEQVLRSSVQAGQVPGWLPEVRGLVQQELPRYRQGEPDRTAAAEQELRELRAIGQNYSSLARSASEG